MVTQHTMCSLSQALHNDSFVGQQLCDAVELMFAILCCSGDQMNGLRTGIRPVHIASASKMVTDFSGMPIQPHKVSHIRPCILLATAWQHLHPILYVLHSWNDIEKISMALA